MIQPIRDLKQRRKAKASSLMDVAIIEKEMKIYAMPLDELPLTKALNDFLIEKDVYKRKGLKRRFNTGDWLVALDEDQLHELMDALSTGLHVDRHDPQYRVQINEIYHITWYLLAAEKGKKKIKMDSKRYARLMGELVDYVGQEIARRKGWILLEGTHRLLGDQKPQVVVTPQGARECPELLAD
jgi:hypothetical protein